MAKYISPCWFFEEKINPNKIIKTIEHAGRTCYKSEHNISDDSAERFITSIIKRGHESVLEHEKITVRLICDRGVSHEIVRHRIASYSQESTRYCNYANDKFGNELTFIEPVIFKKSLQQDLYLPWLEAMQQAELCYLNLIKAGAKPDLARGVLPTDIKTEIVVTMNLREWRHFFKLRTSPAAHPNIRYLAKDMLNTFRDLLPSIFGDIECGEDK